jgi:4a-hydroxytetrahydrobiopterin dehydratase
MQKLSEQYCQPCHENAVRLSDKESVDLLCDLKEWRLEFQGDVTVLFKAYRFSDFISALAFANKIGSLAESYEHHPKVIVEWGRVEIYWWTHQLDGLHLNDFIMAAKTDEAR